MAEGTTSVFGMMGDGNMYWMEALHDLGMQLLEVRHEGAGLGMADGWARVTYSPGVCTATCGPGAHPACHGAGHRRRAPQSALVAFVGESPTDDEEYIQRFDQSRFAEACEAGFVRVLSPETAYDAVRQAFYLAELESRPILLSAPMDMQQQTMDDDEEYVTSSAILGSDLYLSESRQPGARRRHRCRSRANPRRSLGRGALWSGAGEADPAPRGAHRRPGRYLPDG